jgi:hypothetical protein
MKLRGDQLAEIKRIETETGLRRPILIDRLLRLAKNNLNELVRPESSVPAA